MVAGALIFAEPRWFLAIPLLALAGTGLWFLSVSIARRRVAAFLSASRVAQAFAAVDWRARAWRFLLPAVAGCLLAAALARPLTGPKPGSDENRGADLVIALDVSKSMWAEDVAPNRLAAVKEALAKWIREQKTDRIGLVLFAGEAFVQAPLTSDSAALEFVLGEAGPQSISQGGSSIPKAIETAANMLKTKDPQSRVLLIVSDGENLDGDAIAAARAAHQNDGLAISAVGVGTAAGAKVPTYDKNTTSAPPRNHGNFIRNEYGAEVLSRLDGQALRAIASVGGGAYYEFEKNDHFFQKVRDRIVAASAQKNRKIDAKNYDEWFQIPLALAILVMALSPLLGRSRKQPVRAGRGVPVVKPETLSSTARALVAGTLFFFALSHHSAAQNAGTSSGLNREVEHLLERGENDAAANAMKAWAEGNATDPISNYNYALTLYRAGRYQEAQAAFEAAEALTQDPDLKARALFQMGNIQMRIGDSLRGKQDSKLGAVRAFEQSLSNYESQIGISPTAAAKHNRELASDQLETLLLEIGAERTRANTEKTLREAMQAYDRAAELNAHNKPLAQNAKKLLTAELARNASAMDAQADQREASAKDLSEKPFRQLQETRQEIINRYQEAQTLSPGDSSIPAALAKQTEKMADLLTRAAAQQAAPGLEEKRFYSSGDLRSLQGASEKLAQALSLKPDHAAATELNKTVNTALVEAHVENGELALGHLKKSLAAEEGQNEDKQKKKNTDKPKGGMDEKQLKDAQDAAQSFSSALALAPDNERAKSGLAEVNGVLAQLHADVGLADLQKAEAKVSAAEAAPAPPEAGAPENAENKNGEEDGGKQENAGSEAAGKPQGKGGASKGNQPSDLRGAAALLEKAASNLGAAAALQPENADYAKNLARAENLLTDARQKLDTLQTEEMRRAAEGQASDAPGESNDVESGEGIAGPTNQSKGPSEMKAATSLNQKGGGGGAGGGDSKRYWNRFIKDW